MAVISQKRGISIEKLRQYNQLAANEEPKVIGALLRLTAPPKKKWQSVTLKKGESLQLISRRYGCSLSDLRRWNGLGENESVSAGQVIWLKPMKTLTLRFTALRAVQHQRVLHSGAFCIAKFKAQGDSARRTVVHCDHAILDNLGVPPTKTVLQVYRRPIWLM